MKIAAKLGLGMALTLGTVAAAGAYSGVRLSRAEHEVDDAVHASDAAVGYERGARKAREGADMIARGERALGLQSIREGRREMERAGAALQASARDDAERAEIREIQRVEGLLRDALDLLDKDTKTRKPGDEALIARELAFLAARAEAAGLRLESFADDKRAAAFGSIDAMRAVERGMAYVFLAAMAIAALLAAGLTRRIVKPLQTLTRATESIGDGKSDLVIDVTGDDEAATLARAFEDMNARLAKTMGILSHRNEEMSRVLKHVGQGLLTLDRDGVIGGERSAVLGRWLPTLATGDKLWDSLASVDPNFAACLRLGWSELFDDFMPIIIPLDQLPRRLHIGSQTLEFGYTLIFNREDIVELTDDVKGSDIAGALIVVSDITAQIHAERTEAEQKAFLAMFEKLIDDRRGFIEFNEEAGALVEVITKQTTQSLKRDLHTLKGNAGLYGLGPMAEVCHNLETNLANDSRDALTEEERELLAATWQGFQARVEKLLGPEKAKRLAIDESDYQKLLTSLLQGTPRADLARMVTTWKLEPAAARLARLGEQARALAVRLEKSIEVNIVGEKVRVPNEEWGSFWMSLVHVLRNALDHGIEGPEDRVAAGKSESGKVTLRAEGGAGKIRIIVEDDGRGIAWDRITEKAIRLNVPHRTREDLVNALFVEGLSSRDEVSELSGRGVGMGAVRESCTILGGTISVVSPVSTEGGTRWTFELPDPMAALYEAGPSLKPQKHTNSEKHLKVGALPPLPKVNVPKAG